MSRRLRRAPAVRYPLGRSMVLGGVLLGLLLASFGVLAAWVVSGANSFWVASFTAGSMGLVVAGGVLHFWLRPFLGVICWDGQNWALEGGKQQDIFWALSMPPEVFLDLQAHLWVRVSPLGQSPLWLWIERSSQPERWMDLRRAVYSRATSRAGTADETALASRRGRES